MNENTAGAPRGATFQNLAVLVQNQRIQQNVQIQDIQLLQAMPLQLVNQDLKVLMKLSMQLRRLTSPQMEMFFKVIFRPN